MIETKLIKFHFKSKQLSTSYLNISKKAYLNVKYRFQEVPNSESVFSECYQNKGGRNKKSTVAGPLKLVYPGDAILFRIHIEWPFRK